MALCSKYCANAKLGVPLRQCISYRSVSCSYQAGDSLDDVRTNISEFKVDAFQKALSDMGMWQSGCGFPAAT